MMLATGFMDLISNPATLAIFMSMLIPIVAIIASFWHSTEKIKSVNALKRAMVERGMSAAEIERVLAAGGKEEEEEEEEEE